MGPDVIVVGCGPAGLAAARVAAAGGLRVLALERGAAIGDPVRTSGGSFIAPLRGLSVPSSCWWPVHGVRLIGPTRQVARRYRRPTACVLDVRRTYQWLAGEAGMAGADIRLRTTVDGPVVEGGRVVGVRLRGGAEVRAQTVVDASGHAGLLGRAVGVRPANDRKAVGVEVELHAPAYDGGEAVLLMGGDLPRATYGWLFPCGPRRVRVGVGVVQPDCTADARELLDRLMARADLAAPLARSAPLETHTGVMPVLAPGAAALHSPGLVAVGDAAGQGSTLLGEGIRFAILAGRLAGQALVAGRPQEYPRAWQRRVGRDMAIAHALHRRVCDFEDPDWDRALWTIDGLSGRQLSQALAGRFTLSWLLRVALSRPRLVASVGRPLVASAMSRR